MDFILSNDINISERCSDIPTWGDAGACLLSGGLGRLLLVWFNTMTGAASGGLEGPFAAGQDIGPDACWCL
jgi:hypothetical protein